MLDRSPADAVACIPMAAISLSERHPDLLPAEGKSHTEEEGVT